MSVVGSGKPRIGATTVYPPLAAPKATRVSEKPPYLTEAGAAVQGTARILGR